MFRHTPNMLNNYGNCEGIFKAFVTEVYQFTRSKSNRVNRGYAWIHMSVAPLHNGSMDPNALNGLMRKSG